jgi:hypothetical protein
MRFMPNCEVRKIIFIPQKSSNSGSIPYVIKLMKVFIGRNVYVIVQDT